MLMSCHRILIPVYINYPMVKLASFDIVSFKKPMDDIKWGFAVPSRVHSMPPTRKASPEGKLFSCSEQRRIWDSNNLSRLQNCLLGFVLNLNPSLAPSSLPSEEKHSPSRFSGLSVNTVVLIFISPDTAVQCKRGLAAQLVPSCVWMVTLGKTRSLGMWGRATQRGHSSGRLWGTAGSAARRQGSQKACFLCSSAADLSKAPPLSVSQVDHLGPQLWSCPANSSILGFLGLGS